MPNPPSTYWAISRSRCAPANSASQANASNISSPRPGPYLPVVVTRSPLPTSGNFLRHVECVVVNLNDWVRKHPWRCSELLRGAFEVARGCCATARRRCETRNAFDLLAQPIADSVPSAAGNGGTSAKCHTAQYGAGSSPINRTGGSESCLPRVITQPCTAKAEN